MPKANVDPSRPLRILVVDDNEADYVYVREVLEMISEVNYRVDWAPSGAKGLAALAEGVHDLYLFDHYLGGMTGLELLRVARHTGVTKPIFILSGRCDDALDYSAMEEGASDFIVKGELTAPALERAIRYAVENHRLLTEMERSAKQDALTGLSNRRHLQEFLHGAVCRAQRSGQGLGLLLVDLDHFKEINDQHGHDAGDRLLINVARALSGVVRGGDLVARLGGDEFAVVMDDVDAPEDVVRVADEMLRVLSDCEGACADQTAGVGASIGVALYPEAGGTVGAMMKAADTALYEAKAQGRNRYQFFESQMQIQALRRAELHRALEDCLLRHGLKVHYQAQVRLPDGHLAGVEALVRWERDGVMLSPAEFISIAESTGLISRLGEQVLDQACAQFQQWVYRGLVPPDARVAVNVSVQQLARGDLAGFIAQVLTRHGMAPSRLELEITESSPIRDMAGVVSQLDAINALGVAITLDDFGTGHASLTHLQSLPVQTLKIDRSFVASCAGRGSERVLVEGTLAMAHALGLAVVAEGVERDEQRRFLEARGCKLMQGYLFHRPADAQATERMLHGVRDGRVAGRTPAGAWLH